MSIGVGDLCFVEYNGFPAVFHTRLAIAHAENEEWLIAIPNMDLYPEELNAGNGDCSQFFHSSTGTIPRVVPRGSVYAFQPMSAQQDAAGTASSRGGEAEERLGASTSSARRSWCCRSSTSRRWALDQRLEWQMMAKMLKYGFWLSIFDGHKVGEELTLPAGSPQDGNNALAHVLDKDGKDFTVRVQKCKRSDVGERCEQVVRAARSMEAKLGDDPVVSDDVRTLSIKYGPNGEKCRTFRESIQEMRQVDMEEFPLSPRTCLEYLRWLRSLRVVTGSTFHGCRAPVSLNGTELFLKTKC